MKNATLTGMKLTNFKGIENLEVNFSKNTMIYATNGMGKTTIGDAFYWVLYGKDQQDRKDHEIKNTAKPDLNRQDHEVELFFDVDGKKLPLKRVYTEKWTKRRGSEFAEMTGHETTLFFDEVPVTLKDFNERVASYFCDEDTFKLLSNPLYFNTDKAPKWDWKSRRKALIDMAGTITDADVAKGFPEFNELLKVISEKSLEGYKAQISGNRKKTADQLKALPIQIKEAIHGIPEAKEWDIIERQIKDLSAKVESIEAKIADKSKALDSFYAEDQKVLSEINTLKSKLQDLKFQAETKAREENQNQGAVEQELSELLQKSQSNITRYENRVKEIKEDISYTRVEIQALGTEKENLLAKYWEVDGSKLEFSEGEFICPTCNRPHDSDHVEAEKQNMARNFNADKTKQLEGIKSQGEAIKAKITTKESEINRLKGSLETGEQMLIEEQSKHQTLFSQLEDEKAKPKIDLTFEDFLSDEYGVTEKDIERLNSSRKEQPEIDVNDLKEERKNINIQIDSLKDELRLKDEIDRKNARVEELKKEERTLANELSRLEGIEANIQSFVNRKMTMVEEAVNSNFKFVRFRMFNTLINGGTEETCETILDDVPWSSLNTGGRIKAGIDIINSFSKHYGITVPIIIDNRESVVELPETEAQTISFIVSESDKKLRVENL